MMHGYLLNAILLLGLRREDLNMALVLMTAYFDTSLKKDFKQISVMTLKAYTDVNDGQNLRESMERLAHKNVIGILEMRQDVEKTKKELLEISCPSVYVAFKGKIYFFNPNWKAWKPNPGAAYYDFVRKLKLNKNETSLAEIVNKAPVYIALDKPLPKDARKKEPTNKPLTHAVIYDHFIVLYRDYYGKPYELRNRIKDFSTISHYEVVRIFMFFWQKLYKNFKTLHGFTSLPQNFL